MYLDENSLKIILCSFLINSSTFSKLFKETFFTLKTNSPLEKRAYILPHQKH